jgi:hypothetical protein
MAKKSITKFQNTITRSKGLLAIYSATISKPEFAGHNTTDLIRSALVLAVSGLDNYFTSRFSESLVPFLKKNKPQKNLVDILEKSGLDTIQTLEMLTMDRPYRRIRKLIDQYLSEYTTQKFEVIDKLFIVYAIPNLSIDAQGLSKKKRLLSSINKAIKRRHAIAHAADYNEHDNLSNIDINVVTKWIDDIKLFVEKCEDIISKVLDK